MAPIDLFVSLAELAVVILFALVAIAAKALDKGGFLASIAVGYPIFLGGGWRWFAIIASFFILGVGFTWYKYEYKKRIGSAQEKGGARNWPNILANGGVAALFGVGELLTGAPAFGFLYLGAMSAAAADTVATELGLLSRSAPRMVTNLATVVSPGTSGGITGLGFGGAILASLLIGLISALLGAASAALSLTVAAVVIGGVVGSLADSAAGATLQRKSVCVVCGKSSENLVHCGEKTVYQRGLRFVDNNIVNLIGTAAGGLAALAVALLL